MHRGFATEPATWGAVLAFAEDPVAEAAAGRGPKRSKEIEDRYARYKQWCNDRGHTGVQLVLATSAWQKVGTADVRIALEPNIVPYHLPDGVHHWVLWYHPDDTNPASDLQRSRCEYDANTFFDGKLTSEELIAFQNIPAFRSVPELAHAHVFIRPQNEANATTLRALRTNRCIRSPWAESERLNGRGHEVGF